MEILLTQIKILMKTVVVVDDSVFTRGLIKMALKKEGYEVIGEAGDGKTAIEMCMSRKPDFVTLDNILPDMFGVEILQSLIEHDLKSKIIMISAVTNEKIIQKVKKIGASGYLIKPFDPKSLLTVLGHLTSEVAAA